METICCSKCGRDLPANIKHFHRNKNGPHGLNHVCKECRGYSFGPHQRQRQEGECVVSGCSRQKEKGGYCGKHYQRWRKYGDPAVIKKQKRYVPPSRACRHCGKEYVPKYESKNGPKSKYCSMDCNLAVNTPKMIAVNKERAASREHLNVQCVQCGVLFRRRGVGNPGKFCSQECLNKHHEERLVRRCGVCGGEFKSRGDRDNLYCSVECWLKSSEGVCPACGKDFVGQPHQQYCSKRCQRADWWERKGRDWTRDYVSRRKARVNAVTVEKVSPSVVFECDKWMCQICGKPVDPSLKHPNPLCATMDHIIPISKGGEHSYANLQLAHLSCNSRKSNGGTCDYATGQLRMW